MKLDNNSINSITYHNLGILSFLSKHDSLTTFSTIIIFLVVQPIIAIAILILPIFDFIFGWLKTRPLDKDTANKIQERFSLKREVLLRSSDTSSSQAYALPYLKMISLSKEDVEGFKRGDVIRSSIVAHEVGHTYQYDRVMLIWLSGFTIISLVFALFIFVVQLISIVLFQSTLHHHTTSIPGFFLLILFGFVASKLSKLMHRREHLADIWGLQKLGNLFLTFTSAGKILDTPDEKLSFKSKLNAFTHPSFSDRHSILREPLKISTLRIRAMAAQWSAILTVMTVVLYVTNNQNIPWVLMCLVAHIGFCFFGFYLLDRPYRGSKHHGAVMKEYLFGSMSGIFAICLFYLFMTQAGLREDPENIRTPNDIAILILISFLIVFASYSFLTAKEWLKNVKRTPKPSRLSVLKKLSCNRLVFLFLVIYLVCYFCHFFAYGYLEVALSFIEVETNRTSLGLISAVITYPVLFLAYKKFDVDFSQAFLSLFCGWQTYLLVILFILLSVSIYANFAQGILMGLINPEREIFLQTLPQLDKFHYVLQKTFISFVLVILMWAVSRKPLLEGRVNI